ncbi:VIR protein [Plasmodium vivax]|uniref:VIR protein n=1 Tax=Plasmodium vivax TaxID=5855 RepID=A0A1G4GUT8_PLAVI|nr:VIR protein [Plasmodium vivax]
MSQLDENELKEILGGSKSYDIYEIFNKEVKENDCKECISKIGQHKDKYQDIFATCNKIEKNLKEIVAMQNVNDRRSRCNQFQYWVYDQIRKFYIKYEKDSVAKSAVSKLYEVGSNINRAKTTPCAYYSSEKLKILKEEKDLYDYFNNHKSVKSKISTPNDKCDKYKKYLNHIDMLYKKHKDENGDHDCCFFTYECTNYFMCEDEYDPDKLIKALKCEEQKVPLKPKVVSGSTTTGGDPKTNRAGADTQKNQAALTPKKDVKDSAGNAATSGGFMSWLLGPPRGAAKEVHSKPANGVGSTVQSKPPGIVGAQTKPSTEPRVQLGKTEQAVECPGSASTGGTSSCVNLAKSSGKENTVAQDRSTLSTPRDSTSKQNTAEAEINKGSHNLLGRETDSIVGPTNAIGFTDSHLNQEFEQSSQNSIVNSGVLDGIHGLFGSSLFRNISVTALILGTIFMFFWHYRFNPFNYGLNKKRRRQSERGYYDEYMEEMSGEDSEYEYTNPVNSDLYLSYNP